MTMQLSTRINGLEDLPGKKVGTWEVRRPAPRRSAPLRLERTHAGMARAAPLGGHPSVLARSCQMLTSSPPSLPLCAPSPGQGFAPDMVRHGVSVMPYPWGSNEAEDAMFNALRSGVIEALVLNSFTLVSLVCRPRLLLLCTCRAPAAAPGPLHAECTRPLSDTTTPPPPRLPSFPTDLRHVRRLLADRRGQAVRPHRPR